MSDPTDPQRLDQTETWLDLKRSADERTVIVSGTPAGPDDETGVRPAEQAYSQCSRREQPDDETTVIPVVSSRAGWIGPTVALCAMGAAVLAFSAVLLAHGVGARTQATTEVTSPPPLTITSVVPPPPVTVTEPTPPTVTSTTTVTPAPTVIPTPVPRSYHAPRSVPHGDYDQAYLASLRQAGVVVWDPALSIKWGHRACELVRTGMGTAGVENELLSEGGVGSSWRPTVEQMVIAAEFDYPDCTPSTI